MLKILNIIGLVILGFLGIAAIVPNAPTTPKANNSITVATSTTSTTTDTVSTTDNTNTVMTNTVTVSTQSKTETDKQTTKFATPAKLTVNEVVKVGSTIVVKEVGTVSPATTPIPTDEIYKVKRVVDGDTIELEDGRKVRYIGIDTPESVNPRTSIECFSKEASKKNVELVEGKTVRLVKDVSELDKYGRLIRYVYVGDLFVNDYLVRQGYAAAYTYPPDVKFSAQFVAAEKEARDNKRGLWADGICQTEETTVSTPGSNTADVAPATGAHTYYTSSYFSAKFYYCDTDDGWKELSEKYLKSFSSAEELLKTYPARTLHEACK